MIKNKKILIVGAGGFIGGHLVKKLLDNDLKSIAVQEEELIGKYIAEYIIFLFLCSSKLN